MCVLSRYALATACTLAAIVVVDVPFQGVLVEDVEVVKA
jgi:hypothetical protein